MRPCEAISPIAGKIYGVKIPFVATFCGMSAIAVVYTACSVDLKWVNMRA